MTNPKAALRVAVAKDVLSRIVPDESITVRTMTYLSTDGKTVCGVCAIGGLVLSALENRDLAGEIGHHKTLQDAGRINPYEGFHILTTEVLTRVWDDEQLGLIEAAFEGELEGFWANAELDSGDYPSRIGEEEAESLDYLELHTKRHSPSP